MLKGSALIHRSVISRDGGEQVGKVLDLVIDQKGSQVLGLLVDEKGLLRGAHVVRWPAVLNVGEDAGQEQEHLHIHLLGGRFMGWPPGSHNETLAETRPCNDGESDPVARCACPSHKRSGAPGAEPRVAVATELVPPRTLGWPR